MIDRHPADLASILVQALNPSGFAWTRRFSENNGD
jgi:hypothetical protein